MGKRRRCRCICDGVVVLAILLTWCLMKCLSENEGFVFRVFEEGNDGVLI